MNQPIFEPGLSDPKRKEINPLLKFALELGPFGVRPPHEAPAPP